MEKKPYIQPKLAARGTIAEETLESATPNALEINEKVMTEGLAI